VPDISENFTGTNGSAWNASNWNANTGSGTRDIQSNAGRLLTAATSFTPTNAPGAFNLPNDFELRADCTTVTILGNIFLWFRAGPADTYAGYATQGYFLTVAPAGGSILWYRQSSTNTTITTASIAAQVANDVFHFRIRCVGAQLKVRHWKNAAAEPTVWDYDVTDTKYASGAILLAVENSTAAADTHTWDDVISTPLSVAVGTPSNKAGMVGSWEMLELVGG
jgi:hypothetical protein